MKTLKTILSLEAAKVGIYGLVVKCFAGEGIKVHARTINEVFALETIAARLTKDYGVQVYVAF